MNIEQYLAANQRFQAIDVLIPEQCALVVMDKNDDHLLHIVMDNGHASVELYEY